MGIAPTYGQLAFALQALIDAELDDEFDRAWKVAETLRKRLDLEAAKVYDMAPEMAEAVALYATGPIGEDGGHVELMSIYNALPHV